MDEVVEDYAVSSMTQNCRGMRAIDLAGHYLLTDASISFILSNCLSLNYLNLSGLTQLTDTTLQNWYHHRFI